MSQEIAIPKTAMIVKFLQNSVLAQRQNDYVRTAFSKGNTENRVLSLIASICPSVASIPNKERTGSPGMI